MDNEKDNYEDTQPLTHPLSNIENEEYDRDYDDSGQTQDEPITIDEKEKKFLGKEIDISNYSIRKPIRRIIRAKIINA